MTSANDIQIVVVDYCDKQQASDLAYLLDAYARDPMGGSAPLTSATMKNLGRELAKRPHAFSVMAYVDKKPAGLINCFEGFSTFKCLPLVNIHDIIVIGDHRGRGLCQAMLDKVASVAKERGCCKLTLEVLDGNEPAKKAYLKYGFNGYQLDPAMGNALFWEKPL